MRQRRDRMRENQVVGNVSQDASSQRRTVILHPSMVDAIYHERNDSWWEPRPPDCWSKRERTHARHLRPKSPQDRICGLQVITEEDVAFQARA